MYIVAKSISRSLTAVAFVVLAACGSNSAPGTPTMPTSNPPQIACPGDVTVTAVAAASQMVTYDPPKVSDGAAPVTTTCSPESGASFGLGSTTVSCQAADAQARKATCSFNVTLKGMSIPIRKIDAFGDSFTEGENALPSITFVDTPNAYPTKLQGRFDSVYPGQGVIVINRGHGGDLAQTTANSVIPKFLPGDKPDTVLILTGYNDMLNGGCRVTDGQNPLCGDTIKAVSLGVRDCIRHTKESPVKVTYIFVSTLTPAGPLVPPTIDRRLRADMIVQANGQIRQVAATEGAILVDTYPTFLGHEADYVAIDGLHLRPAGYQAIADAFFAAIQQTVPQTPLFGFRLPY